ncbi:Conserved_hypothetical protein [Hexamita inflata]|uniref:Tail specific protease domain-containing protein n=1 Tax=Hexamita inflata TaxID=28002 RepID=A0AA86QI33_9EUKA|nr:Conserved hypothetical protein [Hexamita inflata]
MYFVAAIFTGDCAMLPWKVYSYDSASSCINFPQLSPHIFEQTQITIENLLQLYGSRDILENLPANYSGFNIKSFNITQNLINLRSKFTNANVPAFAYFSAIHSLIQNLQDPHTHFTKPQFFWEFLQFIPVTFRFENNRFFTEYYPFSGKFNNSLSEYEEMFGKLELNSQDPILTINGKKPVEFFRYFGNKYCQYGKFEQARVNFALSTMYMNDLSTNNMIDEEDKELKIQFSSGVVKTIHYVYVVTTTDELNNESVQKLYDQDEKTNPYLEKSTNTQINETKKEERIIKQTSDQQDSEFITILVSEGYYELLQYQSDYVLRILSFMPKTFDDGFNDSIKLIKTLNQLIGNKTRLYLDMVSNGGGQLMWVQMLLTGLFPNAYPYLGRWKQRKSKLMDAIIDSKSQIDTMYQRFDWITGQPLSNWYQQEDYFQFDLSNMFANCINAALNTSNLTINPIQIVFLTDGLCASGCSMFGKKLMTFNNTIVVGFGDSVNYDLFDIGTASGGTVFMSQIYEQLIAMQSKEGFNNITDDQKQLLLQSWMPHNGALSITFMNVFNYNPSQEAGLNHDFVPFVVDQTIELYPSFGTWQTQIGLKQRLKAIENNGLHLYNVFGSICKTNKNVIFRNFNSYCVAHSCEYGYYQVISIEFTCHKRQDQFYSQPSKSNLTWIIVGCSLGGLFLIIIVCWIIYKKNKWCKKDARLEPLVDEENA